MMLSVEPTIAEHSSVDQKGFIAPSVNESPLKDTIIGERELVCTAWAERHRETHEEELVGFVEEAETL